LAQDSDDGKGGGGIRARGGVGDGVGTAELIHHPHHHHGSKAQQLYPEVLPKTVFTTATSAAGAAAAAAAAAARTKKRKKRLRFVFVAGLEGSGHHLLSLVFKQCQNETTTATRANEQQQQQQGQEEEGQEGSTPRRQGNLDALCRNPLEDLFYQVASRQL
jgi:hypothetical protein